MRNYGQTWMLVLAGAFAVACSSVDTTAQDFPGKPGVGIDHERWTRGARIYENLETAAIVGATLLAPPLRSQLRALIARETPSLGDRDTLGFELVGDEAALVVIVSSQRTTWERLNPPATPWSLMLKVGDNDAVAPSHIEAIAPRPGFERYFPAWNLWARAWLVRFPVPAASTVAPTVLDMRAIGGAGAQLDWR